MTIMSSEYKKYRVSSAENLWQEVVVTVHKGVIVESSYKRGVEIGSNFESMRKYWEQFEGENKYIITEIKEEI